jgi:Cu/Ag efflux protein CusF
MNRRPNNTITDQEVQMKRILRIIAFALFPVFALAHGGGREIKGTIVKVTKNSVQVRSSAGNTETFTLTPRTRFTKGKVVGAASDMRVGARAIVHLAKDGHVLEVQLPAEKVGTLQGRIISRNVKKNELKVKHGEVKGIMSAMTTSFHVHDAKVSTLSKNGTKITAKLHASGGDSWLTDVKAVP